MSLSLLRQVLNIIAKYSLIFLYFMKHNIVKCLIVNSRERDAENSSIVSDHKDVTHILLLLGISFL